jgi:hypothetical protein
VHFAYKKKVFVSDLWNFLKEQNIIDKDASHLDPETFIFYIEQLKAKNIKPIIFSLELMVFC